MKTPSLHPTLLSLIAAVAFAPGCDAPSHDLGDSPQSRPANVEREPPAQQPVAEFRTDFAGVWEGEAENPLSLDVDPGPYRFPSGSTRIRLDLPVDDLDSGTITFGEGPSLPPPTDPDVMYPPGAESYVKVGVGSAIEPWEGFPYPAYSRGVSRSQVYAFAPEVTIGSLEEFDLIALFLREGRVIDGALSVQYHTYDLLRSWCQLQPPDAACGVDDRPEYSEDDAGNCFDRSDAGDGSGPVDCGKLLACMNICSELDTPPAMAELTLKLTTDGLIGVFSGGAIFRNERGFLSPIGVVRFRRVESEQ